MRLPFITKRQPASAGALTVGEVRREVAKKRRQWQPSREGAVPTATAANLLESLETLSSELERLEPTADVPDALAEQWEQLRTSTITTPLRRGL